MGQKQSSYPPGVRVRRGAIEIYFKTKESGKYHFERLPSLPSPANIAKAGQLRARIVDEIKHGVFDYAAHFPNSPHAKATTAEFYVYAQEWLNLPTNEFSKSTRKKYLGALNRVWIPAFGHIEARRVTYRMIINALTEYVDEYEERHEQPIKASTYNGYLIPLRQIFGYLCDIELLDRRDDPTTNLRNKSRGSKIIDPFSSEERERIIEWIYANEWQGWGAWFEFAFFTGLRCPSEMTGLTWGAIRDDMSHARIGSRWTRETGVEETTKTGAEREVPILSRAIHALNVMRGITDHSNARASVFCNESGGNTGHAKAQRHVFKRALDALGMRERPAYNTRHTFASAGLMAGANPSYMASILGHTQEQFFKTYAKWIAGAGNKEQAQLLERSVTKINHDSDPEPPINEVKDLPTKPKSVRHSAETAQVIDFKSRLPKSKG